MALQPLLLIASLYLPDSGAAVVVSVPIALLIVAAAKRWTWINPTVLGLFLSAGTYGAAYFMTAPHERTEALLARLVIATTISVLYAIKKVREGVRAAWSWLTTQAEALVCALRPVTVVVVGGVQDIKPVGEVHHCEAPESKQQAPGAAEPALSVDSTEGTPSGTGR